MGPSSNLTGIPVRGGGEAQTRGQRMPQEGRGRDRVVPPPAASPRAPRIASSLQKRGGGEEGCSPRVQREPGPARTLILDSSLQDCEDYDLNVYCSKLPAFWCVVIAALKTNTRGKGEASNVWKMAPIPYRNYWNLCHVRVVSPVILPVRPTEAMTE